MITMPEVLCDGAQLQNACDFVCPHSHREHEHTAKKQGKRGSVSTLKRTTKELLGEDDVQALDTSNLNFRKCREEPSVGIVV